MTIEEKVSTKPRIDHCCLYSCQHHGFQCNVTYVKLAFCYIWMNILNDWFKCLFTFLTYRLHCSSACYHWCNQTPVYDCVFVIIENVPCFYCLCNGLFKTFDHKCNYYQVILSWATPSNHFIFDRKAVLPKYTCIGPLWKVRSFIMCLC